MPFEEIESFCSVVGMDEKSIGRYTKEYQEKLFTRAETASSPEDEWLLNMHQFSAQALEDPHKALQDAVEKENYWGAQLALKHLANVYTDPNELIAALSVAASKGNIKLMGLMLDKMRYKIEEGQFWSSPSPFEQAINNNQAKTLEFLLNYPKIDAEPNELLGIAFEKGPEVLQVLLNHPKTDVKAKSFFLLSTAIEKNNIEMLQFLLQHPRIDITSTNSWRGSLLQEAMRLKNPSPRIVELLLDKLGVKVTSSDAKEVSLMAKCTDEEIFRLECEQRTVLGWEWDIPPELTARLQAARQERDSLSRITTLLTDNSRVKENASIIVQGIFTPDSKDPEGPKCQFNKLTGDLGASVGGLISAFGTTATSLPEYRHRLEQDAS